MIKINAPPGCAAVSLGEPSHAGRMAATSSGDLRRGTADVAANGLPPVTLGKEFLSRAACVVCSCVRSLRVCREIWCIVRRRSGSAAIVLAPPAPWFADPADHAGGTFKPSRDVLTMDAARVAPAGLPCCLVSVPGNGLGDGGGQYHACVECDVRIRISRRTRGASAWAGVQG
jgi:hypothetical protein